ncbi:hypothetical protein [Polyangium jinanense]|uniref:HsdR n=1 Tax=Polyangium jinanense TaxID=2829994 RepID=A0A9X3X883_9BACT|nr:hypothetical protein [Polyangium jinanense]MDC3958923.1 hypothetical protein [Polyangium jinanense]MDC3986037.1 hypothetical protein [Polyangium jinanense]
MPTPKELKTRLDALIANGLHFIEKSATELEKEPEFSVSHFATGIELLLKARLFAEHWTLVASRPHATPWSQIKDGTLYSIQATELTDAITSVTGTPLKREAVLLKTVFAHRNQAVHFIPSQNITQIVGEQFRVWYHIHEHLVVTWKDVYAAFAARIATVDATLRQHKKCLEVRFEELTKEGIFKKPANEDNLTRCPVCEMKSGILEEGESYVTTLDCPVCDANMEVANFGCGNWHPFADGFVGVVACECGETHTPSDLARLMDDQAPMSPKTRSIVGDTRYSCGECLEMRVVVARGQGYRCFACGMEFDDSALQHCGWCDEGWVGYDCSETESSGCEHCDGGLSHAMSKDD